MSYSVGNRREMMIAAISVGVGALVPSAKAQSGGAGATPLMAQRAGETHERAVDQLKKVLGDDAPNSEKGLHKLVDFLESLHLIDGLEASLLHKLIEMLYTADWAKLEQEVSDLLETAKSKAKDLTIAIISVALSSIRSVGKEVSDHKRAILIVSSDVSGACLGAGACWALGPWIAVAAALSGAVSSSCSAWYSSR